MKSEGLKIHFKDRAISHIIPPTTELRGVILLILDKNGKVRYLNPWGGKKLGISLEDIRGKSWIANVVPKGHRSEARRLFSDLSGNNEKECRVTVPTISASGEIIFVLWHCTSMSPGDDDPLLVMATGMDVTELVNKEMELDRYRNMYDTLMDHTGTAVIMLDDNGRFTNVNRVFTKITQYTPEEIIGRPFIDIISPEDRSRMARYWAKRTSGKKGIPTTYRMEFIKKGGDAGIAEITVAVIPGTKVTIASARDLTEEVKMAEELRLSEEKYRALTEQSSTGIFIVQNGETIYINETLKNMLGHDKLEKFKTERMVHPGGLARANAMINEILRGECNEDTQTFTLFNSSGQLIHVEVDTRKISYGGREAIQVTVMDVTERKELEHRLRYSERLAVTGKFAAGIAHEINNPLQNISLLVGNIRKGIEDGKTESKLDELRNQTKRIEDIVGKIQTFSRRIDLHRTHVELGDMLKNVVGYYTNRLSGKVRMKLTLPKKPIEMLADGTQLEQAIMNIIDNSLDAMEGRGTIVIKAKVERGKPLVKLTIKDSGSGISTDTLPHVFEPFYSTKDTGAGMGLGLSICHGIIEAHNGSINIKSEIDKGTEVIVHLPLSPM